MNFNQPTLVDTPTETPRLEIVHKRLLALNAETDEAVTSISRKAGNILDYPPVPAEKGTGLKREEKCLLDAIDIELDRYRDILNWLQDVNRHMSKII